MRTVQVKASKRTSKGKTSYVKAHIKVIGGIANKSGAGKELAAKKPSPFVSHEYDAGSKELTLTFPNGANYLYHNVPRTIEKRIADDPGTAMSHIRKTYVYSPDNQTAKYSFNRALKKRKK